MNNLKQHEFNSFAAHLDASKLTPRLCSKACSAIGYSLAAIERGTMCFCKFVDGVASVRDDDANCTSIPCAGESNLACGSVTNIMVYEAGAISRVSLRFRFRFDSWIPFNDDILIYSNRRLRQMPRQARARR